MRRRYMDERPTDNEGRGSAQEIYCSAEASDTAAVPDHIRPYSDIHRVLFTVAGTRLSSLKTTDAMWKKPNREDGKNEFLKIRNQQLFSLELSETVHKAIPKIG
jgi:hypothetical protein